MSTITYNLKKNRKLTSDQLKELEDMKRSSVVDDPEFPKRLDIKKAVRLGDIRKNKKSINAIVAGERSGSISE